MSNELMVNSIQAAYFRKLVQLMGYVQNGTDQTVILSQDDATCTYHIQCGNRADPNKNRRYFGNSLQQAIDAAYEAECSNV